MDYAINIGRPTLCIVNVTIDEDTYAEFGPYTDRAKAQQIADTLTAAHKTTQAAVPAVGDLSVEITVEELQCELFDPTMSVSTFCSELRYRVR